MRDLTLQELELVSGGEVGATGMGDNSSYGSDTSATYSSGSGWFSYSNASGSNSLSVSVYGLPNGSINVAGTITVNGVTQSVVQNDVAWGASSLFGTGVAMMATPLAPLIGTSGVAAIGVAASAAFGQLMKPQNRVSRARAV